MNGSDDATARIEGLIARLKAAGTLTSPAVEAALRAAPRHRFLETFYRGGPDGFEALTLDPDRPDPALLDLIYGGDALPTRIAGGRPTSSTSEVALMAVMLQLLELAPGMRVLEIGAGTGYNAALLRELVGDAGRVVTLDIQADVVAQSRRLLDRAGYTDVTVLLGDGVEGTPEHAPFDRIVATVGCPDLSPRWAEQLAPDGVMLVPLTHAGSHPQVRVALRGGRLAGTIVTPSGFMPMQGRLAAPDRGREQRDLAADFDAEAVEVGPPLAGFAGLIDEAQFARIRGFAYLLGLREGRVGWSWERRGIALLDPDGGAALLLGDGRILLRGPRDLADRLRGIYDEWRALGSPLDTDFAVEFVGREAAVEGEAIGVIDRTFYRQIVRLARDAPAAVLPGDGGA